MWRFIFVFYVFYSWAYADVPPCASLDPGQTQYYPVGNVQFVGYNIDTQNMAVTMRTNPPVNRMFQQVPLEKASAISQLNDATQYFNSNISRQFPEGMLAEFQSNMCPLLTESGNWIWTSPVAPVIPYIFLQTDAHLQLLTDGGILLLKN